MPTVLWAENCERGGRAENCERGREENCERGEGKLWERGEGKLRERQGGGEIVREAGGREVWEGGRREKKQRPHVPMTTCFPLSATRSRTHFLFKNFSSTPGIYPGIKIIKIWLVSQRILKIKISVFDWTWWGIMHADWLVVILKDKNIFQQFDTGFPVCGPARKQNT